MSNSHEPKCKKVENIPSNMRSYYCSDCDAMHKNDVTYKRPKWFCTACGFHIPYENKEDGTCPACDNDEHDELDWSEIRDESSRGFSDDGEEDDGEEDDGDDGKSKKGIPKKKKKTQTLVHEWINRNMLGQSEDDRK